MPFSQVVTARVAIGVGIAVLVVQTALTVGNPLASAWAITLLLAAPLVIFPIILMRLSEEFAALSLVRKVQPFAAVMLAFALNVAPGLAALLLGVPWIVVCVLLSFIGARDLFSRFRDLDTPSRLIDAGLGFLAIAAFWLFLYLSGLPTPLFEREIVFLTVIHFHYAGFLLPLYAGWSMRKSSASKTLEAVLAIGVVASIPMVATGVTLTALKAALWFEPIAATSMAVFGLGVAWLIWSVAGRNVWLHLAAQTLVLTMPLAIAYAVKRFVPGVLEPLDIPAMRAFHGTANAFGFGLLGAIGFSRQFRQNVAGIDGSERPADASDSNGEFRVPPRQ